MTTGFSHKITVILTTYNPYMVCEAINYDGTNL